MQFKVKSVSLIAALFMILGTIGCSTNIKSAQGKMYKIGDPGPAGGRIFYDKGSYSDGWRYLEAAPDIQGEAEWGCEEESIPGAQGTEIGTGKANTAAIIKSCAQSGIAAKLAADYRGGGKSDWFLPSRDELQMMYISLFLGTNSDLFCWSSSEIDAIEAWTQCFKDGLLSRDNKSKPLYEVRAVRAF